jgi:hypothetical protein
MAKKTQTYDVHPSMQIVQTWIRDLKEKSGRTLEEWMAYIKAQAKKLKHAGEAESRAWLKKEHGFGTNTAWWLVERAYAKDLSMMDDDPDRYLALCPRYVEEQYAGKKAALRPIYDRLYALARDCDPGVRVCPCQTIVPVFHNHVVAQIKPTTNTRVDFGLALGKHPGKLPARLVDTGGAAKKDRITHRIELTSPDQIDAFVARWLRVAYDLDAKAEKPAKSQTARKAGTGRKKPAKARV